MNPCSDCPFKTSSPLVGAPDWLEDVFKFHTTDKYFTHTCHKTDPNADGYKGGVKRECAGHLKILMNEIDNTPGAGGVYRDIKHLMETYLRNWLGNAKYDEMSNKSKELRK